jgi:hypothetical protein
MKSDFKKMEDEMDLLAANMESITSFSEQISCTLQVLVILYSVHTHTANFSLLIFDSI